VITLVVTIEGSCYSGEGQVGKTATLNPVGDAFEGCDTINVDILDLTGTAPNRVLVVTGGRELHERTDLECDCAILAPPL
jgi:hypothetical protein